MEKTGERPGHEAPPLLPSEYEEDLAELLQDAEYRSDLVEVISPLAHELDDVMAQWSPIMLATPELAERLNLFSMMRNAIVWISSSIEHYHESKREETMFWSNLRVFLLLYATFDALRRDALSEDRTGMFGQTIVEHDQAWGLPFKAQKWLWKNGIPRRPDESRATRSPFFRRASRDRQSI